MSMNYSSNGFIIKNMKVHNHRWIWVFFILWLPVQGGAAAILSVCMQEKSFTSQPDKSTISIDSHHHDDCHKQADDNATNHLLASLPCDDTSCDAYSNTPIMSGYTAPMLRNNTSAVSTSNSGFISFVPEQPQRPPLTAFL